MISGIAKVVLSVDDQEEAKRFWSEKLGFHVVRDEEYGDERWVEVAPVGGSVVLVPSPRVADDPRRDVPEFLPHSNVFFDCDDIEQTYSELKDRGVSFPTPPAEMHFGWWALFADFEGTRYALGQWERQPGGASSGHW